MSNPFRLLCRTCPKTLPRPSCPRALNRPYSSLPPRLQTAEEIRTFLSTPTSSIHDFLPPKPTSSSPDDESELTSATLHHLLRLSALPPPESKDAEEKLLKLLREHLSFVRSIQSVDTAGVQPLVRIQGNQENRMIEFEDIVGAEKRLEKKKVGEMGWGGEGWKVKQLGEEMEGRPRGKGIIGGFYVVDEMEEGGAY
ncbi:hypothetical protein EX30DRAFT_106518 [Ascodesmis nigricans]|uniref:Glutamyl-tRNA amidotransferase complex subunit Gta3 domain-containing protein n=1 Tax=Ascodesmis nigricans TaxID=341454 RepID=A0A4S2N5G0_9PEZI|nr:hypothetical protein EX30DRAFT_106518 [Ascodesmis nigricans]